MGSRHSPANQVRSLYQTTGDPVLEGLKAQMLGPAKSVDELARRFGTQAKVSSVMRAGEDTAHGHGFGMDWAVDPAHGAAIARRMNQLWGQDYFFDYHPNRIGVDEKGLPIFSKTEKHLHGQLRKHVYRSILEKTPHLDVPEQIIGEETQPGIATDPTSLENLASSSRLLPVNQAKSAHLNLVSSQVPQGPELPPTVVAGGFSLPGGPRGRPGDARSASNRDQLNRANAASGRATLIGGF